MGERCQFSDLEWLELQQAEKEKRRNVVIAACMVGFISLLSITACITYCFRWEGMEKKDGKCGTQRWLIRRKVDMNKKKIGLEARDMKRNVIWAGISWFICSERLKKCSSGRKQLRNTFFNTTNLFWRVKDIRETGYLKRFKVKVKAHLIQVLLKW